MHDTLKPKLGTYIICKESVPEQAYKELATQQTPEEGSQSEIPGSDKMPEGDKANIHILEVGFDQAKLETIINVMLPQQEQEQ